MTDYQDHPASGVCVVTGLYRETVTTIRHLTHHTQNSTRSSIHNPASLQWTTPHMTATPNNQRRTDPTPAEIEHRSAAIRRDWSVDERMSRLRADLRPSYRLADGRQQAMSNAAYSVHHEQRERLQQVLS
jgi:hypothetical protein